MIAFYPAIGAEALPSDYLLERMSVPSFQYISQLMIFCALLETGVGVVNAVNERIAEAVRDRDSSRFPRIARRSEEHTSELQSLMRISYAVFCLKKKHIKHTKKTT